MADLRKHSQELEDNILAILDNSGVREARDVHEDRLTFLEAVRAACIASVSPSPPSWKMFDTIFHILRDGKSLELAIASYQLLSDLDQRYPRVSLKNLELLGPSSGGTRELVVVKVAWSPFRDGLETSYAEDNELCEESNGLFDSLTFSILIEDIAMKEDSATKAVQNMVLFQYLIRVVEADFLPRQASYREASNWILLRESILNMLLGSRKMQFKSLVRNCISIISKKYRHQTIAPSDLKDGGSNSPGIPHECNVGLSFAFAEIKGETCDAMGKLLMLILELDVIRKEADTRCLTSRSDGFRVPVLDNILDELTYDKDLISPFLEVFGEPKWRLEIVLQYIGKYYVKPSTRTRSSNDLPNDTFESILNCFSTVTTARVIVKRVTSEVARLLLAHAFQAYLLLLHDQNHANLFIERIGGGTPRKICNSFISAFKNIRKMDQTSELTSFEKEALFTAIALISQNCDA